MTMTNLFANDFTDANANLSTVRGLPPLRTLLLVLLTLSPIPSVAGEYTPANSRYRSSRGSNELYSGRARQIAQLKAKQRASYKAPPAKAAPSPTIAKPLVTIDDTTAADNFLREKGFDITFRKGQHRVEAYTVLTPEGALFNSLTHQYDKAQKKVFMRPQFVGLRGYEKREVYAKLGIQVGPRDPQRWQESRQAWEAELASRKARRLGKQMPGPSISDPNFDLGMEEVLDDPEELPLKNVDGAFLRLIQGMPAP